MLVPGAWYKHLYQLRVYPPLGTSTVQALVQCLVQAEMPACIHACTKHAPRDRKVYKSLRKGLKSLKNPHLGGIGE